MEAFNSNDYKPLRVLLFIATSQHDNPTNGQASDRLAAY